MSIETDYDDPDGELAREQFDKHRSRFLLRGLSSDDVQRLERTTADWNDWCRNFSSMGEEYADLGAEAGAEGDHESAAQYYTQAAMFYHYGSFVWLQDRDQRTTAHRASIDLFKKAASFSETEYHHLEIPVPEGGYVAYGNLALPPGRVDQDGVPLVVMLPGSDSTKEENFVYAEELRKRGMATLAMEGPGQGETWYERPMGPGHHHAVSAAIDLVTEEIDVEFSPVGAFGVSLGGYYAPSAAAHDDRIAACLAVSGRFTVGPASMKKRQGRDQYQWACRSDSLVEVDETTEAMSLRDSIDQLTRPLLMITGSLDRIVPPSQSERVAERAPDGEFIEYPNGGHCCTNIYTRYFPKAVDWLKNELVPRRPGAG